MSNRTTRRKALVVAERAVDRIVMSRFVALAGISTIEADPESAITALAQMQPDLVVIDAGPDNDQHGAIIAAMGPDPRPEVLVVASERRFAQRLSGEKNIDAAICKPLTTDKVVPSVRDLLDLRSRR